MSGMILVAAGFVLGILLRSHPKCPPSFPQSLTFYILHISLPALAFLHFHNMQLAPDLLLPALMPWWVFGMTALLSFLIWRLGWIDKVTAACFCLVAGIGNTSIVGFPVTSSLLGIEALPIALVTDQSNFVVFCLFSLLIPALFCQQTLKIKDFLRKLLFSPALIAMVAGFLTRPWPLSNEIETILEIFGTTLTPVAMVALGAQFKLIALRQYAPLFGLGLLLKLAVLPFTIWLGSFLFLPHSDPLIFQTTLLQAATPPMILAGLIAIEHDLNPPLAQLLISLSIPISFMTSIAWCLFLV